ncbi:replication protein [Robbsia andropogonis]|uniref:replication protein n=1 Tax=Robbsia andropogonis TaxID=28092 RepID=UPI00209D6F1D|nr:replication protein [Robbsia andropogonis]MCP1121592.1 replication protein [Robbsia andropogonis]MCP1131401.1 replication protein [Robbsia andropogonis]
MASGSSPQVEDGYTRIANELFDAALAYPFTGRQLKVFMAIVRKTYGYNKKRDDLSASQIGDLCGVARNHVTSTLNELSNLNIITKLPGEFGSLIEINKNYRRWADPLGGNTSQNRTSPKSGHVSKNRTSPESGHVTNKVMDLDFSSPKSGLVPNQDATSPESGQVDSPESGHTKDNLPKDNQQKVAGRVVARPANEKQSASIETWKAYAEAYRRRYQTDPVRNAMVNGQLANFCKRLSADEAPQVAAFYVGHNNRYYVGQGHSVSAMLKDAEKLRMEWDTGRRITAEQAQQADRTQSNANAFNRLIAEARAEEREKSHA